MRVSTMTYILKQGFKNIWRNIRFSLASIATMAACIFLFGIFLSLVMNFRYMVHSAEEGVAVVVYFDEGVKQEQIDNIGSKIKKMSEVERAEYVSADQAWEAFRDEYLGGDDTLAEGFRDQDNPLANSASYQVYLKNVESQDKVVKEIENAGGKATAMQCDISDFNKCSEFTNEVKDRFGSIDILVNNAGITRDGLCMAMKEEDFDAVINTNLKGTLFCIKFAS